jgi:hypothetical protein
VKALRSGAVVLLLSLLGGCGQQLVEFGQGTADTNPPPGGIDAARNLDAANPDTRGPDVGNADGARPEAGIADARIGDGGIPDGGIAEGGIGDGRIPDAAIVDARIADGLVPDLGFSMG